jgi:hypothetical protein
MKAIDASLTNLRRSSATRSGPNPKAAVPSPKAAIHRRSPREIAGNRAFFRSLSSQLVLIGESMTNTLKSRIRLHPLGQQSRSIPYSLLRVPSFLLSPTPLIHPEKPGCETVDAENTFKFNNLTDTIAYAHRVCDPVDRVESKRFHQLAAADCAFGTVASTRNFGLVPAVAILREIDSAS